MQGKKIYGVQIRFDHSYLGYGECFGTDSVFKVAMVEIRF
jgi:hypothetical protein